MDLSRVVVHADSEAAQLCHLLGANAFTTGRDVFFASGRYAPASTEGRAMLSHELEHVRQQAAHETDGAAQNNAKYNQLERQADARRDSAATASRWWWNGNSDSTRTQALSPKLGELD